MKEDSGLATRWLYTKMINHPLSTSTRGETKELASHHANEGLFLYQNYIQFLIVCSSLTKLKHQESK